MHCASCGQENRGGASFCDRCGAALARSCPNCQANLRPASRFCDSCGQALGDDAASPATADPRSYTPPHLAEKILRERAAAEGERRTVTVLFIDAKGSTAASEKVEPEEARRVVQECTQLMVDAVHRFEGTVTQFRGDGIMALFGAPIAHEDSARRAVSAAIAMRDALRRYAEEPRGSKSAAFMYRIGLNTGPVVVGHISDDLAMDYTAIGDTVNLAARMEEWAQPESVYITEDTYLQSSGYFEFRDLDLLEVRGRSGLVHAYEVLRELPLRTRLEIAAERGLTPFIGREQELAMLRTYLEQAQRSQGQVVFVSGEAGIGKSRLLLELRGAVAAEGGVWLEGHCVSYGRNMPYLPLIDVVKGNFGVQESDDDKHIIERIDSGTALWDETARATVPYLKFLLNVEPGDPAIATMDPLERRAGIMDGLRALLIQESRQSRLFVVVEDLHWIDEQSEEALTALVDLIAGTPILLVLTHRPGYSQALGDRTYYNRLALRHLAPADSATLAGSVLHGATLPSELAELIVRKAEGNPFFIEEVTKSLLETGVLRRSNGSYFLDRPAELVVVPNTVQEVILSRIDRLEVEARQAIQLASVIGREFTVRLLDRISDVDTELDSALGELKGLELIYEKAYYPELSYMFKHALTHEVALSTLLVERRRALHRIVAAAIEELYSERLAEHYEALALHYYEGQSWEKALDYLEKAGDKAAAGYANEDAVTYYGRALEVCTELGSQVALQYARIAEKQLWTFFTVGDLARGQSAAGAMLDAARSLGDRRLEGTALAYLGMVQVWAHEHETAEETLRAALALADEHDLGETRFQATVWLAENSLVLGDLRQGERLLAEAQGMFDSSWQPFARWFAPFLSAVRLGWAAEFDSGIEILERLRGAQEEQQVTALVLDRWWEGILHAGRGEYQQALALWGELLLICERTGEVQTRIQAMNSVGWVYNELHDNQRALEWNRRGADKAAAAGFPDPECESNARLNVGDSLLALGRFDEAEEQFAHVERIVRDPRPQDRWVLWSYAQHLCHSYGELCLARQNYDDALSYADECIERAEGTGRKKNIVKGRRLRAQALQALGELDEAEREIARALEVAKEVGNPPQLWKTHAALGELRQAQGRPEEARQAYREALAVIDRVAAGLTDESLRQTFFNSDQVRGLRASAST
ncbi:MAG: adenylate/guanylate cyclase domain-containing protein [Dehalococcoidia bacterium]